MDADLALSIGTVLAVVSVPSIFASLSEARTPRLAVLALACAVGLIVWAASVKPGGYSIWDVPGVLISVFARYIG